MTQVNTCSLFTYIYMLLFRKTLCTTELRGMEDCKHCKLDYPWIIMDVPCCKIGLINITRNSRMV